MVNTFHVYRIQVLGHKLFAQPVLLSFLVRPFQNVVPALGLQELLGFKGAERLVALIDRYGLPVQADYDKEKVFEVLSSDKKKEDAAINFILLQRMGKGVVEKIKLEQLNKFL